MDDAVEFRLNGVVASVARRGSLLDALRESLGVRSPKDGCSPQGQCGCCTVWVDGKPRVSCVTPVSRVAGRDVTTIEGLENAADWTANFSAHGASQCGFCTTGIIMRLAALPQSDLGDDGNVRRALQAHLCRCTGWQPIIDAARGVANGERHEGTSDGSGPDADRRAAIEGHTTQTVGPATAMGQGGFADDTSPVDTPVALRTSDGEWVVGTTLHDARLMSGKVQGRRTTTEVDWPVELPDGEFDRVLQTTWVEPAYLEPDASWCAPAGQPASCLGNGGAFGGKTHSEIVDVAQRLASEQQVPVKALYTREDVVRLGPKRPPLALGIRRDGTGVVRVAVTADGVVGFEELTQRWPRLVFEQVPVAGPSVSLDIRGAVETEILAAFASLQDGPTYRVETAQGAVAEAQFDGATLSVQVQCGDPLDEVVLRSYCAGAAHMAYSWVTSEAIRLDAQGDPADLTIRSFGICRATDTPTISVQIVASDEPAVNGSDVAFAAVAAAVWSHSGFGHRWPTGATTR